MARSRSGRFALAGAAGLRDAELAALALGTTLARADAWLRTRTRGEARPLDRRHAAWRALARRIDRAAPRRISVGSVAAAVALLTPLLASLDVEELHVLALDAHCRVLDRALVARGAVNQVAVTAREVFRPLVAAGASSALVAHNHPSGDPTPSRADRELTVRLWVVGELLGIPIIDHVVFASGGHYSFAESDPGALCGVKSTPRRGNGGQGIGIR